MSTAELRPAVETIGPDEVAELLGVSKQSVLSWSKAGRLPRPFRVGRTIRWRRDVILALLDPAAAAPPG